MPQPAENHDRASAEGMPVRGTESAERVAERGAPAHYDDAVALYPSAKDLGGEDLEDLLYAMEIERNEAHRYANGEIDEKPENYDYWSARDGLWVRTTGSFDPTTGETVLIVGHTHQW